MKKHLKKCLTHGDLFSGIGAFKCAFEYLNINHKTLYCSEIDKYAYTSYKAIHGDVPNFGDISKISIDDIPYTDVITYGFPCQDISVNGLQKGIIKGETRSGLLYEALRIIKYKKPKFAIAENVKNLIGKRFINDFNKTLKTLEDLGYVNKWVLLNAKNFGLPQNRERVFIISIRKDIYPKYKYLCFSSGQDLGIRMKDLLIKKDLINPKYFLSKEKINKFKPSENFCMDINKNSINVLGKLRNRNDLGSTVLSINGICKTLDTMCGGDREPKILYKNHINHINHINEQKSKKNYINNPLISYSIKKTMLDIYNDQQYNEQQYKNKLTLAGKLDIGVYEYDKRVYDSRGISSTICARNGKSPQHILDKLRNNEYIIRKLTPLECWRLQGFKDKDFYKARQALINNHYNGRDRANSQLYKQAGNSIAINCLFDIYKQLFKEYM